MKNLWKAAQVYALVFLCAVFLGAGIKAEAAGPKKVTEVKQIDADFNSAEISWKVVPGNNVEYKVEICARRDFKGEIREQSASMGYKGNMKYSTIAGEPGKTYYVRVTAFYNSGYPDYTHTYGASSDVLQVVTTPRDEPKNFRVTNATETSIKLAWDRPAGANSYRLTWDKYGKNGGSTGRQSVELGNVTSYTVNKLSKNARYSVRIQPINKSETGYKAEAYLKPTNKTHISASTLPPKVTGLNFDLTPGESSGDRLYYDEQQGAYGIHYEIYTVKGKKPIVKGKPAITGEGRRSIYIKNKKLKGCKFLKLRVRAYIVVEGKQKYGKWSNWEYFARQPEIKAKKVSGGIKLSWSKVEGADNYTVYVTDDPDSKYKKFKTTKRTSIVLNKCGKSKLKNNKRYFYYVVANKKVGKKTYRSNVCDSWTWSFVYKK